jgi:hypothetical protein
MKRGTIILGIAALIAVGILGVGYFLQTQPPVMIEIAVDPLAEAWMRQAVKDFNDSNVALTNQKRVEVTLTVISDLDVWNASGTRTWTPQDHPDLWMPGSSLSINYATGMTLDVLVDSTARTPLIFGGYAERINILTDEGANPLTWDLLASAAETASWEALGGDPSWRFINYAFSRPDDTISGLGVLLSAAAEFADTSNLSADNLTVSFRDWFEPVVGSVPNFNNVTDNVAQFVAVGGVTRADVAFGPESQWLYQLSALNRSGEIRFSYPAHPFVFNFPLVRWGDPTVANDTRNAEQAFANWLMNADQQRAVTRFGLRPATGALSATDSLFANAEPYGVQLNPNLDDPIQPPPISSMQGLLTWFNQQN